MCCRSEQKFPYCNTIHKVLDLQHSQPFRGMLLALILVMQKQSKGEIFELFSSSQLWMQLTKTLFSFNAEFGL